MDWLTARLARERRQEPTTDHVRNRRPARDPRAAARAPRGLSRLRPGEGRKQRRHAAPARHLRRARRLDLPVRQARDADLLTAPGTTSPTWSTGSARTGIRPTRESGRPAADAGSSPTPGCSAGSRSSERCGWPPHRGLPIDRPARSGPRPDLPARSTSGAGTRSAGPSSSTTTPTFSTPRSCCMPLMKFTAPSDPRWLSTLDAIGSELVSDSLVYRYNAEASPDGLAGTKERSRSARSGTSRRCTRRPPGRGASDLREDAHLRQPPGPLRRGDRPDRGAARELPPGLHPPRADQRGGEPGPPARVTLNDRDLVIAWMNSLAVVAQRRDVASTRAIRRSLRGCAVWVLE